MLSRLAAVAAGPAAGNQGSSAVACPAVGCSAQSLVLESLVLEGLVLECLVLEGHIAAAASPAGRPAAAAALAEEDVLAELAAAGKPSWRSAASQAGPGQVPDCKRGRSTSPWPCS